MLTKRIIPCLDVKDGKVVKGVNFKNLVEEGDPIEFAKKYSDQGADELTFLDISATLESRKNVIELVKEVAKKVFIPFTVGGGIKSPDDIGSILEAGADKVSINSSAIYNPNLLNDSAKIFGSQCIVLAMDVKKKKNSWYVYTHAGTNNTKIDAIDWAKEAVDRGCGEILLTSMDADGTQKGIDDDITSMISDLVDVPIIASGGIGKLIHFKDAIIKGKADAVLAASVFHRDIFSIDEIKDYLNNQRIPIRK